MAHHLRHAAAFLGTGHEVDEFRRQRPHQLQGVGERVFLFQRRGHCRGMNGEGVVAGGLQAQTHGIHDGHARIERQMHGQAQPRHGDRFQTPAQHRHAQEHDLHEGQVAKLVLENQVDHDHDRQGAEDAEQKRQGPFGAGEPEDGDRLGLPARRDQAQHPDQPRDDEDREEELDQRHDALRYELPPQLLFEIEILFEFPKRFRQMSGFLADAGQRQKQRRKGPVGAFQGGAEVVAGQQRLGHLVGHRTHAGRSTLRLLPKNVQQGKPGTKVVTQHPAQDGQIAQGKLCREEHLRYSP